MIQEETWLKYFITNIKVTFSSHLLCSCLQREPAATGGETCLVRSDHAADCQLPFCAEPTRVVHTEESLSVDLASAVVFCPHGLEACT